MSKTSSFTVSRSPHLARYLLTQFSPRFCSLYETGAPRAPLIWDTYHRDDVSTYKALQRFLTKFNPPERVHQLDIVEAVLIKLHIGNTLTTVSNKVVNENASYTLSADIVDQVEAQLLQN